MRERERERVREGPRLQFHYRPTATEAVEAAAGRPAANETAFFKKREKECPKLSYVHPGSVRNSGVRPMSASQPASQSLSLALHLEGRGRQHNKQQREEYVRERERERESAHSHSHKWGIPSSIPASLFS